MPNYFIVHALGNIANDYWYPWLKKNIESKGFMCFSPTLPPIEEMSYYSWEKEFNNYKKYLNEDSIVIGHSTGSVFLVKYLINNNIKVRRFIGVVSFNKENTNSPHPDWEIINKSFFVNNLEDFKNYAKERICFYSPTDIYDYRILEEFAKNIDAKKEIIANAGHFTANTGYGEKFEEIIKYI